MKFDVCYWQKWHVVYHKGLIYAIRSSSNHPNTFKEWFEIVKQQWVSLLVAQHHIPYAERVPENWNVAWNLRFVVGRNDILWIMRGSYILSKAPLTIFTHLRKAMKHFIDNRYLSLHQHSSTFPVLWGCPKSQISMKFGVCYWHKWPVVYHKRLIYDIKNSSNHSNIFEEWYEVAKQQ